MKIKNVPPFPHIPPGAPRGWSEWCEARGLDPERPETHSNSARLAWDLQASRRLRLLRDKWRRYAADGTVAAILRGKGRTGLIRWVRQDWAEVLRPYPQRSPYTRVRLPRLGMPEPAQAPRTLGWLVEEYGQAVLTAINPRR